MPLFIEAKKLSGDVYVCWAIYLACFYDFSIRFWNYSTSAVFLFFILFVYTKKKKKKDKKVKVPILNLNMPLFG